MPSPKSVMCDIHDLGLNPSVPHKCNVKSKRLEEVKPKEELEVTPDSDVGELIEVEQIQSYIKEQEVVETKNVHELAREEIAELEDKEFAKDIQEAKEEVVEEVKPKRGRQKKS